MRKRTDSGNQLIDAASTFGAPTFVLVVLLVLGLPRFDRALEHLDRVDAQLTIIAASCDVRRLTPPLPPVTLPVSAASTD